MALISNLNDCELPMPAMGYKKSQFDEVPLTKLKGEWQEDEDFGFEHVKFDVSTDPLGVPGIRQTSAIIMSGKHKKVMNYLLRWFC